VRRAFDNTDPGVEANNTFVTIEKGIEMKTESHGKANANCCDGKLVKVAGDNLTSTCAKGDEHHYTVAADAKVTCDGKASKSSDLKAGSTIRMTMSKDDKNKVTAIDCGKHIPELVTA
jgi:hypothetical protein